MKNIEYVNVSTSNRVAKTISWHNKKISISKVSRHIIVNIESKVSFYKDKILLIQIFKTGLKFVNFVTQKYYLKKIPAF